MIDASTPDRRHLRRCSSSKYRQYSSSLRLAADGAATPIHRHLPCVEVLIAHVPPLELPIDEVRRELDRIRHPFRVVLERAKNPFNIGAIIRTAHSFLAKEIILVGDEPWYERAAMGMHRFEHLVEIPTVEALLDRARREGWKLCAFEKDHARAGLWEADLPEDAVMVFGNEDTGVSPEILAAAHQVIAIPMFGLNHSYPITVAAGIAMAEWARRHYRGGRLLIGADSIPSRR